MKSREDRRREARFLGLGMLGAVAALLALYVLVEGSPASGTVGLGPVIGASVGAAVTYMLTRRQRREEDAQRRRALATSLLSEIRFLERLLRDITTAVLPGEPGDEMVDPYRTAVYDSAGANLLLFSPDTVHDLDAFYQLVHRLREELQEMLRSPLRASVGQDHSVRLRAIYAAAYIEGVARRLRDNEGGMWPLMNSRHCRHPSFRIRLPRRIREILYARQDRIDKSALLGTLKKRGLNENPRECF